MNKMKYGVIVISVTWPDVAICSAYGPIDMCLRRCEDANGGWTLDSTHKRRNSAKIRAAEVATKFEPEEIDL